MRYDVAVVGLGAAGSAALYHLARRGVRAVGIERYQVPHENGSYHGLSRIIRLGYHENPAYVPLLRRAYELWADLERQAGRTIFHRTGIAEIGAEDSAVVSGTLAASRQYGLPHEILTPAQLAERYPQFSLASDHVAVLQPDGGFLIPEAAVTAHVEGAVAAGADLAVSTEVRRIEEGDGGVRIETDQGAVTARHALVTAGAFTTKLFPELSQVLVPSRRVLGWFKAADPGAFAVGRFPVFIHETEFGNHYGFPIHGLEAVKVAKHTASRLPSDPEAPDRTISAADEAGIRDYLKAYLPGAAGPLVEARICHYMMTPDGHFLIDRLPGAKNITVASPCSGHGFKFATVMGELLADLALDGGTQHDIGRFALSRFET